MMVRLVQAQVGGERAREGILAQVKAMEVAQMTKVRGDVPAEPI